MALLGISEAARLIGRDAETVEPRPRLFWYTRCPLEFRWIDLALVLPVFLLVRCRLFTRALPGHAARHRRSRYRPVPLLNQRGPTDGREWAGTSRS
jgi:hypothetical protein